MGLAYFCLFNTPNFYSWLLRCLVYGDLFEFLKFCACDSCFNKQLRIQKVCYIICEHFLYLILSLKVIVEVEEARVKGCNEVPAK
jgi:hypothetical protein